MRKIAIANRKGGVGKTTTAVNLAHGLAMTGERVLLVDTDTQGHCSRLLGINPEVGLAELIEGEKEPTDLLIEARERLFLLAGGKTLGGISRLIARQNVNPQMVLTEALSPLEDQFDYVILDTAPGFTELSVNALFYADEVMVPVSMEVLAVQGFKDFLAELSEIQKYRDVDIRYIVPTFVDGRVKKTTEILNQLQKHFSDLITTPIHYSSKLSEAPSYGETIYEFAPRVRVAKEYAKLAGAIA